MLKNIPSIISPELMYALMNMGHGDEICFGDANFPADSMGPVSYTHLDVYKRQVQE